MEHLASWTRKEVRNVELEMSINDDDSNIIAEKNIHIITVYFEFYSK